MVGAIIGGVWVVTMLGEGSGWYVVCIRNEVGNKFLMAQEKANGQWEVQDFTTRICGPSHYTIHSFFSGLHQFHYSDIWPNIVEWANDHGHVAMTNGTLVDWSSDII